MARIRRNNSFTSGILNKKVQGNTDNELYNNALDECVNFQVGSTGGLFKRGGSHFISETYNNQPARLLYFSYQDKESYLCEFTEKCMRIFFKHGQNYETLTKLHYPCLIIEKLNNQYILYISNDSNYNTWISRTIVTEIKTLSQMVNISVISGKKQIFIATNALSASHLNFNTLTSSDFGNSWVESDEFKMEEWYIKTAYDENNAFICVDQKGNYSSSREDDPLSLLKGKIDINELSNITGINGFFFAVGKSSTQAIIVHNEDASLKTWKKIEVSIDSQLIKIEKLSGLAYNRETKTVAVVGGCAGNGYILTTKLTFDTDNTTPQFKEEWEKSYFSPESTFYDIVYSNNKFIATADSKYGATTRKVIITSADEKTWECIRIPEDLGEIEKIKYSNNLFIASTEEGKIFLSRDGKKWDLHKQVKGKLETIYPATIKFTPASSVLSSFTFDEIKNIKYVQSNNTVFFVSSSGFYRLSKLKSKEFEFSSISPSEFSFTPLSFKNDTDVSLKIIGEKDTPYLVTVNSSSWKYAPVFYTSDESGYLTLDYQDIADGNKTFYFKINKIDDDVNNVGFKKITCEIDKDLSPKTDDVYKLPNDLPVKLWQISAFNKDRGFPLAIAIHEGRLFLANNSSYPSGIWGSSLFYNDLLNFYTGPNTGDSIQYKSNTYGSNEILWLASQSKLFIGTTNGIYIGGAMSYNDEAITSSNFRARNINAVKVSSIQPVSLADTIFFIDSTRRNVYNIISSESGIYQMNNLFLLADDLSKSGIIDHAWIQSSIQSYWCAVEDGHLCSLTYSKDLYNILAWSKHIMAGANAKVENIITVEGENDINVLYMVVQRIINGEVRRYIEYLHPQHSLDTAESFEQFFVDSGISHQEKYPILDIKKSGNIFPGSDTTIIINRNENFPLDYQGDVYIDKVSSMTEIGNKKYKVNKIISDGDTIKITLYDYAKSFKSHDVWSALDSSTFHDYDNRVGNNGNLYLYFQKVSGLEHLIGQEVDICSNGNSVGTKTVDENGTVTLDNPSMSCAVGLKIKAWFKTTPFSGESLLGASLGSVGSQKDIVLNLYNSLGGNYGSDSTKTSPIPYQNRPTTFDEAQSLYTGLKKLPTTNKDIYNRSVYVEHSEPLSFNVLAVTQDIQVSDA